MTLPRPLRRLEAAGVGLFTGITVALLVGDGNYVALAAGALFAVLVFLFTRALTPSTARHDVYLLMFLALTLRYAVAVTVHDGSLAAGRGGFVTGDDANYADFSWTLVQLFRGEPVTFDYSGYLYLLGTFVYLETAIFALVGPNVVVVELLNAALGAALVAMVCDLCRRLFEDERASLVGGVLVAFYPSLVLWTSLNLKDSLALFLIALVLWLIVLFNRKPAAWLVLAMYVALFLMESLRFYIFVGLAIVIPIGVLLAPAQSWPRRLVISALAVGLSLVLVFVQASGNGALSASLLARLESERAAMALGARTGFGRAVVLVQKGATYVIQTSSANPPTPPGHTPRTLVVQPNDRIVVGTPTPGQDATQVSPGDILIVASSGVTPSAAPIPQVLPINASSGPVQIVDAEDALVIRTLAYLPFGLAFALFAPLPGSGARAQDLLPIPEMLVWYVLLIAAAISLWRWRRRWRVLGPALLFVVGTLTILAIAEGNVGTLYRHRAMVIPFVVVLAAPTLGLLLLNRTRMLRLTNGPSRSAAS